ncbi:putative RNA-directed DNA polymerase, eukaryota, reverse transcriptase zinc-binding domain protein [Tanacetum coccineum]
MPNNLKYDSGAICEDKAKRRNSGAKMKTFEENCYLLLYAISSKEDTAYQRQLITRIRVKDQFPIRHIHVYLYAICTAGHQSLCGVAIGMVERSDRMGHPSVGKKCVKDGKDIYEIIDIEYSPIPVPARRNISNQDELCKTEEFTVIRYSMGLDEEFIAVEPSKISIVERTLGYAGDVVDFRTWPGISLETSIMSTMDLDGVTCLTGRFLGLNQKAYMSNSRVTCEDEAKRRNSGAKMKTIEENCYLLLYAVSSKEDTAYQRQLITRIRIKDQFPIRRITLHLYAVCTAGHQSKICNYVLMREKRWQYIIRENGSQMAAMQEKRSHGGLWIWIQFSSSSSCSKFQENSTMKNLYYSIKTPSPSFKVEERMIWIEINRLPLCAWGSNAFKKVASLFGKFKFFEDEESTALSSGRVCISTRKDEIFVDDNPNDDLNDLNDKLNELAQATKDEKIHFECSNATDLNQPREQVEEEFIKVSDTSDLSRPPGFEYVKRSSSSTSKCSTNFARHQKKDIKADLLNSFIDSSGLIDLPIGGRYYTRMNKVEAPNDGRILKSHEKLRCLKTAIKQWHSNTRNNYRTLKQVALSNIKDIEKKIDDGSASSSNHDKRIKLLQDIDKLDKLVPLDLIQKYHINLTSLDRDSLETHFSLDEIKTAIWDCGSNKALGPDGLMPHVLLPNSIKRGLWQGDPLSPFLFILAMEVLHGAMSNAVNSGLIRGIKLGFSDITLSHLFYADDVVITFEWNSTDLDNIIWVLHVFHLASGLKINIHKSNIYGFGVSNHEASSITSRTGCAAGFFPFTYLGLPIGSNMNLTSSWNILVERF